jgi:diguanylate cyclase (GGDEF)-like protein
MIRDPQAWLRTIADVLDDIEVAVCVFDADDATVSWNRHFLQFFPEHAGQVQVGEPYQDNLRRFYELRLRGAERALIDRYIDEGLARHRAQHAPYSFEHGGRRLQVASLPLPDGGRIRVWSAALLPASGSDAGPVPASAGKALLAHALPLEGVKLFDLVADGVLVTDPHARVVAVNRAFARLYGLDDRATVIGIGFEGIYRQVWARAAEGEEDRREAGLATLAEQMRFTGAPFELPLPGGRCVRVIEQRNTDAWGFFSHVDISVLKRQQADLQHAEQRARDSEARLRAKSSLLEITLERMEQGIMMVNAQRIVEVCNRRAIELLGLPPDLMGRQPAFAEVLEFQWAQNEFVHTAEDVQAFVRAGGILDRAHSYDRKRPDGRVIEVHSVPIDGGGVLRTYTDITERKRTEERIRHVARHDGLTSLVNREAFLEQLAAAVAAQQQGGGGLAVHFLDLDGFKPVNDRLGHAVGDKLLTLVAARMRSIARDGDIVARLGGDEFAILQQRVDQVEAATGLARRVLDGIQRPIEIEGQMIQIGASIGVALCPQHAADAHTLLRLADQAMYQAKASQRGTVRVFEPTV